MKRSTALSLFVLATILFANHAGAQKTRDKVLETIRVFPYQHRPSVDAALTTMNGWGKSEWKSIFQLLDDDSLKVTAADALHAYINAAAADSIKKRPNHSAPE